MTEEAHKRLKEIAEQIKGDIANKAAPYSEKVTVRDFLGWFGYFRRARGVVSEIRHMLDEYNLRTVPDFEVTGIDALIRVEHDPEIGDGVTATEEQTDPTVRVGAIEAANRKPTSVTPTAPLSTATTLMLMHDFSQLPVMETEHAVKGVISWQSIGTRLSLGHKCPVVRDCMDSSFPKIPITDPLSSAIGNISRDGYVLVTGQGDRIVGIVTASDVTHQFMQLAGPFLNIGEIEGYLRILIHRKFTTDEMRNALAGTPVDQRSISGPTDLTLGEYRRLLERKDLWEKLGLDLDRKDFVKKLERVTAIRNDVMHFNPDGMDPEDTKKLEDFANFLRRLRHIKAI